MKDPLGRTIKRLHVARRDNVSATAIVQEIHEGGGLGTPYYRKLPGPVTNIATPPAAKQAAKNKQRDLDGMVDAHVRLTKHGPVAVKAHRRANVR